MKEDEERLGRGIEAIFKRTVLPAAQGCEMVKLPYGHIVKEGHDVEVHLELAPGDNLGRIFRDLARRADAGEFENLVDVQELRRRARDHHERGLQHYAAGRLERALSELRKAATYRVGADLMFNIGVVLDDLGRRKEAAEAYAKALRCDPDHLAAHVNLAILHYRAGRFDKAMEHYQRLVSRAPELVEGGGGSPFPQRRSVRRLAPAG